MSLIEKAKQQLSKLESCSRFEKMLKVTAILTSLLEKNQRPIIVGGLSVEIYTRSDYATAEILVFMRKMHLL